MRRVISVLAVVAMLAVVFASPALGAWSRPIQVAPRGTVPAGAELMSNNVLRVWWHQVAHQAGRGGVWLATRNGRVRPVRPVALDRAIPSAIQTNGEYQEPVFLPDGRSLQCMVSGNFAVTRAQIYVLVYSANGSLIKKVLVADQAEAFQEGPAYPTCQVSAAGGQAVVMFTQATDFANGARPSRQIYVATVSPGLTVSTPVAILASGDAQHTIFGQSVTERVTVSRAGWIAVAWVWANITRSNASGVAQQQQWRIAWVSPGGSVGATVPLTGVQDVSCTDSCQNFSVPEIFAVADQRVLVVAGLPYLRSAEVDVSGQASPWTVVSRRVSLDQPDGFAGSAIAGCGGTVVVTWGSRRGVYAVGWRAGRWSGPALLTRPTRSMYPVFPIATVNLRGQSAVWWQWDPVDRRQARSFTEQAAFSP